MPMWTALERHAVGICADPVFARPGRRGPVEGSRRIILRRTRDLDALAAHRSRRCPAELVANGAVTADSYAGLARPAPAVVQAPVAYARRGRRTALFGIADAGRWSLLRRTSPQPSASALLRQTRPRTPAVRCGAVEQVARTLLKRYGVSLLASACTRTAMAAALARSAARIPPARGARRDSWRPFHCGFERRAICAA